MKYYSQIPRTVAGLNVLGEGMEDGLHKYSQPLDIKQVTEAQMKTGTDAMVEAEEAFNASRTAQDAAYATFHVADDALTDWLGKVTGALSTYFGKRWNGQWVQVGFITPSIRVPATISDRLALVLRVTKFLTANPSYEAANQGVTAAIGNTLRANATSTHTLALAADTDLNNKGTARDGTIATLTSLMRMLVGLLSELLNADDPRWLAFGLQMPARLTTPAAPAGLTAVVSPTQENSTPNNVTLLVTCDPTPYATRYRFRTRDAGLLGSKYKLTVSSTEPVARFDVPASATVEIIVQAANGDRQSIASDAIVYQPAANGATASAPVETPAKSSALKAPATTTPNGSNGKANGNRLQALK